MKIIVEVKVIILVIKNCNNLNVTNNKHSYDYNNEIL